MNKPIIALICTFCLGGIWGYAESSTLEQSSADVLNLSLDDCLGIALNENPTVKVADMEITRVDYSKIETISQLMPQASFSGTYSRTLQKQVMYMNMDLGSFGGGSTSGSESEGTEETPASRSSSGGGNKNGIKVGLDNSYQVGFSASLPLVAPQLWASLKLSDSQILATVEKARASRLDLVNQVKSAYYALMLALDSRKVLQESYDMAEFTHDMYVKQQAVGAASDYDVLRTSVAMKNIVPQLIQADIAIKQARLQLLLLMGISTDTQFEITESLETYESTMYEEALAAGKDFSQNSSLVQFDISDLQLQQALKVQKASLYPTLAATANYMWSSMSNGSPVKNFRWTPYSVVGLSLNIPLFTGGGRYSRIKQAQVQVDEMKWQRENLVRSLTTQVDLATDNIKMSIEQIASASESVKQAVRAHDIMEKSFAIGAASYLELRDAELALTSARLSYYQAIYNLKVAQSGLELLLGNAPLEKYEKIAK